ncbi:MAG TPA: selenocysteine-specific translation elongation factor [Candidatus Limnocylindrales bacterium]|nr:selenocysteine-specific translation elongation factor [Candidatus Limnocylindrales bacterium]
MTVVIGTAGHIDHGKTTLLRALTGIDADRLPEERRRGMTIDVGYAHLALPDGTELDFVDVPGHDRLVGNMLVGAGEIDAAMLVVAADDGPRAQTVEHLELLDAIGIGDVVAVVTKADLVDRGRVEAVIEAVSGLVARTSLADSPVLAASATSGEGIDEVRAALLDLRDRASAAAREGGGPRLGVDRAFSIRGRGAVVTGSLRGGSIARGMTLRLWPDGRAARAREVQVHGRDVESAGPGRVAVNLAGIDVSALRRGMVLAADGVVQVSDRLLVALRPPAAGEGSRRPVPGDRARVRLHLGTDQVDAVVGRGGRESIALADGEVTAILRLERPVAVADGDRFVLRRPSPGGTEAGGRVLDASPPTGVPRRRLTPERLAALAAAGTAERETTLLELHGARNVHGGSTVRLAPDVAGALSALALRIVADRHAASPAEPGPSLAELRTALAAELRRRVSLSPDEVLAAAGSAVDALVDDASLVRDGDRVRDPRHVPAGPSPAALAAMDRLEAALDVPAPPPLTDAARAAGCTHDGLRALEATGRIVRVGSDLAWSTRTYARLASIALDMAGRDPLTPAAFRDATGTSRKYVMAILEDLDRRGWLRRTPDGHLPGPRAPLASERAADGTTKAPENAVVR